MDTQGGAQRQARSFPRLMKELYGLEELLEKLYKHAQGLHEFMGLDWKRAPEAEDGSEPRDPVAPMVWIFNDLHKLKRMAEELNRLLEEPLRELQPTFYEVEKPDSSGG